MGMMLLFIFVALTLLDNSQGKAGIQYRISTESFNRVAKVLTTQPNGYFVYSKTAHAEGQIGAFMYKLTNFRVKDVNLTDVSVTVTQNNHLKAEAIISKLQFAGHVSLKRNQSEEAIFEGFTEVVFSNNTFISEGKIEYVGVSSSTVMTMPYCDVVSQEVSLGAEFLQAVQTSVPTDTLHEIFTNAVCSVYKLQFSLGFPSTTLDFDMNLFKLHVAFYPSHLAITNDTLLLMYMYDLRFSDAVSFPLETDAYLPTFPPLQKTASPFEIWVNNDVFNDFLDDFLEQMMIKNDGKIPINDILPILPIKGEMRSEQLFIIPKIPTTFPNSTVDLYVTDANVSFEITPEKCLLNLSVILEVQITLNCDRSKIYTPLKLHVNASFPVQFGYNQERITLKYVLFGGDVTVLETTVGKIADKSLSHIFFILPQWVGGKVFDDINKDIKGPKLSNLVPVGTFLHNVTVSTMQGYLVIHGNLTDEALTYKETNQNLKWLPEYTTKYLENLWFPLYDNTPEDQKGIPIQDCKIHTSGAYSPTKGSIYLIISTAACIVLLTLFP